MLPLVEQSAHRIPDDARYERHVSDPAKAHDGRGVTRRGAVRTLALALALAAAPTNPLGLPIRPAEAARRSRSRSRTQTVTKRFSSDGPITIAGDASVPYPSIINVRGFRRYRKAKITDVNVAFRDLSHTYPNDINIMLVHRSHQVTIMSEAADGTDAVNVDLTLDDQAGTNLPSGSPLTSGAYEPANLGGPDTFPAPAPPQNSNDELSTFNGDNPDGIWQLYVSDAFPGLDSGVIADGWELEITAEVKKRKRRRRR